jgi:hypothetical protein
LLAKFSVLVSHGMGLQSSGAKSTASVNSTEPAKAKLLVKVTPLMIS